MSLRMMLLLRLGETIPVLPPESRADSNSGLDASIGFETERAENIGVSFVNATIIAMSLVGLFSPRV